MAGKEKAKQKSGKKEIARLIAVAVGIFSLIFITAFLMGNAKREQGTAPTPEEKIAVVKEQKEKKPLRILVAGCDRSSGLTDVLMLVNFDREKHTCTVLQLPRDTYAAYTEGSYRKLNGAAHALGGMRQLCDFLSKAFGISIDRYARIELDAFRKVVDAIGGVEVNLPFAMDYDDPYQGLSIHLSAGVQTLDGKAAEQFVRYRSGYVRGDIGRMDAQKIFLSALFCKLKSSLSPTDLVSLAGIVLENLETDLTLSETVSVATEGLTLMPSEIYLLSLPGEEAVATISGAGYYVLSGKACTEMMERWFGGNKENFDPDQLFRNPRYEKFCEIYDGYTPYEVYDAGKIVESGVKIDTKH